MAVIPTSAATIDSLDVLLRRAGAVFAAHDGRSVVVNYGSAAGELAVCVRAVGLLDRSELTKLVLQAPAAQLGHLVTRLAGRPVSVGGALQAGGAWWCGLAADRMLVLCEPAVGRRLCERLSTHALHHVALTVNDRSEDWVALALIGRATAKVLAALPATVEQRGDARRGSSFAAGIVRGVEVSWLLESDRSAVALAPRAQAGIVWQAIEDAGRQFGISCVGREAASRYMLLERGSVNA